MGEEEELSQELVELLGFIEENQVERLEISGEVIASALEKFPKERIVRLGDAMLSLEEKKKVLAAWSAEDQQSPRLLDYAREFDKQVPILNFTEGEVQVITFFSDIYIECKVTSSYRQSFPPAEEMLDRLISRVLKDGDFPSPVFALFEWGFTLLGEYQTIFWLGHKNKSERADESIEQALDAILDVDGTK